MTSVASPAPAESSLGASLGAVEVTKDYLLSGTDRVPAIGGVTLEVAAGEFVSVVGPSGCGKTTLLRCLSGLMRPDSGTVTFDGRPVTGVPGSMSIVFQEYGRSLLPWLTAARNVSFGLRDASRAEAAERAAAALDMVGIGEFAGRHPWQLSGGMQQRVAIARAIARRPRCLLMDEPFASVDALTRESLEELTLNLASQLGFSTLLVTHDIDEAIFMADRVVVLSARPSRVLRSISIDLARPRDEVETRANPLFQEYRREIHSMIRGR
jgi:NitT/TauT family transport system ATP-binding protein